MAEIECPTCDTEFIFFVTNKDVSMANHPYLKNSYHMHTILCPFCKSSIRPFNPETDYKKPDPVVNTANRKTRWEDMDIV